MEIAAGVEPVHPTLARIADIDDQHAIYVVRGKSLLNLGKWGVRRAKKEMALAACVPYIAPKVGRHLTRTRAGLREHRD